LPVTYAKDDKIWKIIQLIEWTSNYFGKHGIESYRLKTELLLAHLLNCTRLDLYRDFDKPLTKDELVQFKLLIKRVINHEPVQMILGSVPFVNIDIYVNSASIVPRPETELLTAAIIDENKNRKGLKILDIGTGSGCIGLSLAKAFPDADVLAIDFSNAALALAKKNMLHNNIKNVTFNTINVSNELIDGKFDIIVSNPPYIAEEDYQILEPEVKDWEPALALTDNGDGLSFYRRYAEIFPTMLQGQGKFYLEFAWGQAEKISEIFSSEIFSIEIKEDANNISRYVFGNIVR